MDGSAIDPIIITVVVVISLAAWPIAVAYAARHPAWEHGPAAPHQARPTALPGAAAPLPRTEIPCPVRQPAETRPMVTAGTNEACDRCGPAVAAAYRVDRQGELYLCGHCTNQLSPALSAQGWTIWPISECASRPAASYPSPAGAGPGGQDAAEMAAEADAEPGARGPANADLILASELSAHAYAVHFEAQMRGGKVHRLLRASCMFIARACAFLAGLDPQAIR
jgi:ribosomal protein S27AE